MIQIWPFLLALIMASVILYVAWVIAGRMSKSPTATVPVPAAEPVKEFWQDDFDACKKLYPHGLTFPFSGVQLTVIGYSYLPVDGMGLCPRLNCVYRDARGILQRFDFDETNLPLLLAKDPVVKK
jgi:hypothetical protein